MGTIVNNNPNVSYNYQKVPGLVTSNLKQSKAGLAIALRDNPNYNRNLSFDFPSNQATPNFGAGSPTLLANTGPKPITDTPYAGTQVTY